MDNLRRHFQLAPSNKTTMAESRSTFHTHVPLAGTLQGDINDCCTSSANFLDFMIKFCGAGTHMAESFTKVFQNTPYSEAAGQFHNAMKELFMATNSVTSQMKSKLDTMLFGLVNKVEGDTKDSRSQSQEHLQVLAKGYLHVIRLHCQFVLTSTEVLSQFYDYKKVEDLIHHGQTPGRNENDSHISALQSLAKLTVTEPQKSEEMPQVQGQSGVMSWPPSLVPVTNSDKTMPDIWSQKPPKHPGYGNQRSYVMEGQPSRFGDIGSRSAAGQSLKNQNDIKTNRSPLLGPCNRDEHHLVTQEELDNVIDFLSGGHHGNKPLESIPESTSLPPTCMPPAEPFYAQYPPPVFTQQTSPIPPPCPPPPPPSTQAPPIMRENDYSNMNNTSQHRLSDGALGEMVQKTEIGRNTWPHRGNPDIDMQQQFSSYGSASSFGSDPEFLNYVASIGAMIGTGGQSSHIWSAGSGELKLHHSWPTQGFQHPEGRDNLAGSWSGQQDTSSSDESANEEALLNTCLGADLANNLGTDGKSDVALPPESLVPHNAPGKPLGGIQPKLPPKQPWADKTSC